MKKVVFALLVAALLATASAAASPLYGEGAPNAPKTFATYAAQALTYFNDVKAQVLGAIANNATLASKFVAAMASQMYDLEHVKAEVLNTLTSSVMNVTNYDGGTDTIDFAEFLASSINDIEYIKGEVLKLLATDYFPGFADGIANQMIYRMKIVAQVVYDLMTI